MGAVSYTHLDVYKRQHVRYTYVQSTKVRYRTCYFDTQLLFNYDVKNIWIFLSSICDFRTLLYWGRITLTAETDLIITVNPGVKTGIKPKHVTIKVLFCILMANVITNVGRKL